MAQEEARRLNHRYIGSEHILLGLLSEHEGVAARALLDLNVSLDGLRDHVEQTVGKGDSVSPPGHIPFTPRAKKILELSLREALQLGHNYIGTEHILLGLCREDEGLAKQALAAQKVDLSRVRQAVIQLLGKAAKAQKPTVIQAQAPLVDAPTERLTIAEAVATYRTLLRERSEILMKLQQINERIALGRDYLYLRREELNDIERGLFFNE